MRLIGKKVDLRPIQEEDLPELIRWGRESRAPALHGWRVSEGSRRGPPMAAAS